MTQIKDKTDRLNTASTLLEIGSLLMSSGASTMRLRITINRIANALGYNTELMISHRALMLTLIDEDGEHLFSRVKRISPHGVNFKLVSGICHMSWYILDEQWTLKQINNELDRLKSLPHYPRIVVLLLVAIADAAFCHNIGGSWKEMSIAFIATFIGLWVRQESTKRNYNPYICIYLAALTASIIASCSVFIPSEIMTNKVIATSVLFLIPGIPLINSITDLIDGNLQNGMARAMNGCIISFAIALGLLTAGIIFKFQLI